MSDFEENFNNNFEKRYKDYFSIFSNQLSFILKKDVYEFIKLLFMNKNMRFVDNTVHKAELIHKILVKKESPITDYSLMCGELLISYLSLCKDRRNVYRRIFGPQRCNPSHTTFVVQPCTEEDNLNDLNAALDNASSKLQIIANDVWILIGDLWDFIVYLIINNGHAPSTTNYSFGCTIMSVDYSGILKKIYDFLLLFNDKAFIL